MAASKNSTTGKLYKFLNRIAYSGFVQFLLRVPPFSWLMYWLSFFLGKKKTQEKLPIKFGARHTRPVPPLTGVDAQADTQAVLEGIVRDVVKVLGYIGASIAIYETDDALSIRSTYIERTLLSEEQLRRWEWQLSQFTPERPVSLSNPKVARVYVHNPKHKKNLSVRAAQAGEIITSKKLYDLFMPVLPSSTRDVVGGFQKALGINQVVAVPFFLNATENNAYEREHVGNLLIASEKPVTEKDKEVLLAFTRHIALTILSERRHTHIQLTQGLALNTHRHFMDEQKVLDAIAKGIVTEMGYAGAMVATYEEGGALPVKAIYIAPALISVEKLRAWEEKVSKMLPAGKAISLFDPAIARVYLNNSRYRKNLGVRSATTREPITSSEVFDLFRPITPKLVSPLISKYQENLGIRQVISVPFFLDEQFVGNLFVATKATKFTSWEIEALRTFGHQAAAGLRNARLYNQAEARQAATEILGRMAFNAAASVHTFRNDVGLIRGNLQLLENLDILEKDEAKRRELLKKLAPLVMERLDNIALLLDELQSPWALRSLRPVDVNLCLKQALSKVGYASEKWVHLSLVENIPEIEASKEILTEIFRGIIKNAVESLAEKGATRFLWVESRLKEKNTMVEINIRDNGIGIKPENLSKVFEILWSTKLRGLGLGLFWARNYVEGLGGTVKLESIWQEGTTCIINIPLKSPNTAFDIEQRR